MLWKLLKYDFRSMWKQFSIVWPAALILAFINRFTMFGADNPGGSAFGEWMAIISISLFSGVCFAMVVVSVMFVLTRFYRGLLGDEGYLMHTLPVRSWQLVLSKLICALVTTVVNGVVGIAALFLMVPLEWNDVFDLELWQRIMWGIQKNPDAVLYFAEFCLLLLTVFAVAFTWLYLSMAIGHLFHKRRIVMSVAAFFVIDIVGDLVFRVLHQLGALGFLNHVTSWSGHSSLWTGALIMMVLAAVMFLATSWILSHRLNLE